MKQQLGYKYRCYPTDEQKAILARTFGCVRFIYNWGLRTRTDAYFWQQKELWYEDLAVQLTTLKKNENTTWLSDVSSVTLQQTLRHLEEAFDRFHAGTSEYPTKKRKKHAQSVTYASNAFKWIGGEMTLAKMDEPLQIAWSRPLPEGQAPIKVTVSRDSADRYFISFYVKEDIEPLPVNDNVVGIDLGIHDVVTLSNGEKSGNEHFFTQEQHRLKILQRRHSKKQKGSRNREKARLKVANLHAEIADRRRDWQHKLTTKIVRENQTVCIESLSVENMLKNHCLAKAISDVGWGEIKRQLTYKAKWYGRTLVAIDRFYPSSKRCHACGFTLDKLGLEVRRWQCPECGISHDRDINAALNIRAAGLAVLACGGVVSPSTAKAGLAHSDEAGTPLREFGESPPYSRET